MMFVENMLEKMITGLSPLREKLIERRIKHEKLQKVKRFIKKNPIFKVNDWERWGIYEKDGLTELIYRVINDPNGSYMLDEHQLYYRGKDDSAVFWVCESNYPYSYGHVYYNVLDNRSDEEIAKIGIDKNKYRDFNSSYSKASMEATKDLHDFCEWIEKQTGLNRDKLGDSSIVFKRKSFKLKNRYESTEGF